MNAATSTSPPTPLLRHLARRGSEMLLNHPRLYQFLKDQFLKLPASLRGPQLIYDHLRELARENPDRTFCLVGANDGVTNDHVFPFASRHRWRGALVEPVPIYFAELEKAYRGLPVKLCNVAIHDTERSITLHYLDATKIDLPPWAKGVGSFDRKNLEKLSELPEAADALTEAQVPCRRLEEVIAEAGLDCVDIVVIDTEGYDGAILRQVRFDEWRVKTVIFEHKLLPAAELADCIALLERHGFSRRRDAFDVLATRSL
jgi:FkbM family methyltransferase